MSSLHSITAVGRTTPDRTPAVTTLGHPCSDPDSPTGAGATPGVEDGMTTAEYAVGTLAACAFAALLFVVVQDSGVRQGIVEAFTSALATRA
ncbi:DUF4244 domain-containing protein [Agilicoccus flavus]|uniref:DUF4244 domain-containing protein n=1 Tax=Agilicoccus flavus TaxID=2775968 RepID=UPI001CF684C5|nr:DUF4244 domain-containing protein [Agilicoccus flavus]